MVVGKIIEFVIKQQEVEFKKTITKYTLLRIRVRDSKPCCPSLGNEGQHGFDTTLSARSDRTNHESEEKDE